MFLRRGLPVIFATGGPVGGTIRRRRRALISPKQNASRNGSRRNADARHSGRIGFEKLTCDSLNMCMTDEPLCIFIWGGAAIMKMERGYKV